MPAYLYSAKIVNNLHYNVAVVAHYQEVNGTATETLEQQIVMGHSHTFGQKKVKDHRMYITRFEVFGENREYFVYNEPFVKKETEKTTITLERGGQVNNMDEEFTSSVSSFSNEMNTGKTSPKKQSSSPTTNNDGIRFVIGNLVNQ
ncbi:hypothetical protein ABK040_003840 [Willaertia magna]